MTNRTLTTLVLCAALTGCGGSDANESGAAEPSHETRATLDTTEPSYETQATHDPVDLPSAVMLMSVEVECPEHHVYFSTGSAELTPRAEQSLDAYAACLRADVDAEDVDLTGMTDPRGTEPFNERLARDRAQSVATYLASRGVDTGFQINAVGEQGAIEGMPALWPAQRRVRLDTTDQGS